MNVRRNNTQLRFNLNNAGRAGRETYHVNISDIEQVYFVLTRTFAHLDSDQVLNVLNKAEIKPTAANDRGEINFRFIVKDEDNKPHTVGFVNYYDNDLAADSTPEEIRETIEELARKMNSLEPSSIVKPLTADQATGLIDSL